MARARVKVHVPKTGRYVRVRVKSPKSFKPKSFRTHDIGRAGHSKRVAGKLKKSGRWGTQAYLIPKKEFDKPSGQRLMKQIKAKHG